MTFKDNIIICLIALSFVIVMIYSFITNNFLAKTFVLGLEGCHMFFMFVMKSLA